MPTYTAPRYAYRPVTDRGTRHPVVIVGGGMVGLTVALDLAQRGIRVVLLDDDDTVSVGSRAICFAKRTLEIYGRLGLGGGCWTRAWCGTPARCSSASARSTSSISGLSQGTNTPAFVNLQQYYIEQWLVEACEATGLVDLRWRSKVVAVEDRVDHAVLAVETPEGGYEINADWLLAAGRRAQLHSATAWGCPSSARCSATAS